MKLSSQLERVDGTYVSAAHVLPGLIVPRAHRCQRACTWILWESMEIYGVAVESMVPAMASMRLTTDSSWTVQMDFFRSLVQGSLADQTVLPPRISPKTCQNLPKPAIFACETDTIVTTVSALGPRFLPSTAAKIRPGEQGKRRLVNRQRSCFVSRQVAHDCM